jgi:hypothetical protein
VQVVCKYYSILYKRLEHLWILIFHKGPGTTPPWIPGMTVILYCQEAEPGTLYRSFEKAGLSSM